MSKYRIGDGERMRELSREEHEMIFNLLIIEFMNWYKPRNKEQYDMSTDEWSLFHKVKCAFPMDEFNKHELVGVGCSHMKDGSVRFNYITRSYNYVEDAYMVKN